MNKIETHKPSFSINWSILKKPWFVFASMALGVFIGLVAKDLALQLAPIGELYLSFLKMCVLPIMIAAVVSSFGGLISSNMSGPYLKRIIVVLLLGMILTGIIGIIIAQVGKPGVGLNSDASSTLGQILMEKESTSVTATEGSIQEQASFLEMVIPTNIFQALIEEQNLKILFFSIVFGICVGLVSSEASKNVIAASDAVFKAFEKAISFTMYALPIGLMCMLADQIARTGLEAVLAMSKFIIVIHLACVVLIVLCSIIISRITGVSVRKSITNFNESILIAFGTRNSYAAIPSIFKSLQKDFSLNEQSIHLIVPIHIVIGRYSMILVFSIGTIFVAQLYGMEMGILEMVMVLLGALLAALASAGAPAIASMSMMSIVLGLFALPIDSSIILILTILSIIDPILTVLNVYLTSASTLIIAKPLEKC